eukprot:TCONS_00015921-protein
MACLKYLVFSFVFVYVVLLNQAVLAQNPCNNQGRGGGCDLYCHYNATTNQKNCSCGTIGELLPDGLKCHIKPRLVFGYINSLVFADDPVNGQIKTTTWEEFGSTIVTSIAQDYEDERIFWLAYDGRLPYSFGFIRVGERRIKTVHQFNEIMHGVAYDHKKQDVYLTGSTSRKIYRIINYDSDVTMQVQTFKFGISAKAITIDSVSGLMFVVDTTGLVRINMTDKTSTTIIQSDDIISITLDRTANKVFWASDKSGIDRLEMINYDGTCRKLIQEINSKIPKSIVFWQGLLYWTDSRSKVIYKTNVEDGQTKNTGIPLSGNVLTVDFYGDAENYTGEWSQWALTEPTICRRRCLPPPIQTYYKNTSCIKRDVSKFVNNCGDDLDEKLECGVTAKSMSTTIIIIIAIAAVLVSCIILCCINLIRKGFLKRNKLGRAEPVAPPLPPPRQNGTLEAGAYPLYEHPPDTTYETIPDLQQQMKLKALEEFKLQAPNNHGRHYELGRTQSSNTYLDTHQLVVDLGGSRIPQDMIENTYAKEIDEEEPKDVTNPNYDRVSLGSIDETYCTAIEGKNGDSLGAVAGNPHYDRMDTIEKYDSPRLNRNRPPLNAEVGAVAGNPHYDRMDTIEKYDSTRLNRDQPSVNVEENYDVVNDVVRKKALVPIVSDDEYLKVINANSIL